MKTRGLKPDNLTHDGLVRLINRDHHELNTLSDDDLRSLWSFFKYLCTDHPDVVFVTPSTSIIAHYRTILREKYNIRIKTPEEAYQ